mmetsp:Transcript_24924/g.57956  ORF Transcript_24924/g.57956 Transcript_24924/m.57956 type:complete len:166 (+) Transcript_24924:59-556(+)|eukprot:CAMPEP_0171100180 /NCGR_PEP_ID=MMETSP0766_2-20121228/52801_1 /TAXON_ID=439317 /ORGANISM="Gambierdiscus australes, Strain CAWD 149" /LENGTH=165 /DNA_ID=CAMNT_0011559957 /DNA_START=56 /DNA_END=553 /DNA_ORIENTATION=-
MTTLHQCARDGNIGGINEYLDQDEEVDIDVLDEDGKTALHWAAAAGDAAAGALLVECDANVNIADKDGNTPLHMTAVHNHRLVTSMLLWGGADVTLKNAKGNTALHEAAAANAKDVAWLIIENGKVDSIRQEKNNDGKSPIDLARENANIDEALVHVLETGEHVD